MADYKISLGIKLKTSEIREQISKYNSNSNNAKLKLGVKLDTKGIGNQIKSINSKTPIKVNLKFDTKNVQSQINSIKKQIQQLGNIKVNIGGVGSGGGKSSSRNVNSSVNQLTTAYNKLRNISKNIGSMKIKLNGLDASKDINQIETLEKQLQSLTHEYHATVSKIKNKGDLSSTQWQSIQQQIDNTKLKLEQLSSELTDTKANFASNVRVNFGDYKAKLVSLNESFGKLSNKTNEVKNSINNVQRALRDMQNAGNDDDLIEAEKRFQRALKETEAQLKINKSIERQINNADNFSLAKESALLRLEGLFEDGSEAAKKYGSEVKKLKKELDKCGNIQGVQKVNKQISNLDKVIKNSNLQTQTFAGRLKSQFQKYKDYFSVASIFMYASIALKDMFNEVVAIDTAMTELKKVTDETDASYSEFLNNAASSAKELGTTIDGLVESTADFARLGYGFEDAQGLAEVANIYAVVGDEVNGVEGATESLISTMAAFKGEMNGLSDADFATSIVDKFNEIGNNFAISSGGIGEALTRSASSMVAANNTLDETIALITAANTVVQDPDTIGTAFKTISMRIRGAKTELEEAGLETDGMVESTAKLREEIMALSGVDIMLNKNEFKSTYQIIEELSNKWQDLTDIQQASITELIAGKRQGNIVSSLMTNFDIAEEALQTSLNSTGSAMKEHDKYMQSLEAKINRLKATWQSLSQSFMDSDFLKGLLDGVTSLVNALDWVVNKFGALPTILGAFAGGRSLFSNKGFAIFDKETKSIKTFGIELGKLGETYKTVNTKIAKYNSLNASSQEKLRKKWADSSSSFGKYISGLNGSQASMGGYIKSLAGAALKTVALEVATVALNTAITMGVSFLISTAISAISKWINASEELAEKVDEVTSKYKEQHEELKKLQGDYDASNESSMISRYEKLSKGVDSLGRNVSLTTDEYSEYQSIVETIASQIPSLITGYDEQGNALLSCKGNVEELTTAYEKLIHAQNQEILTNTGDIEKDFANTIKEAENGKWYKALGIGGGTTTSSIELLEKILNGNYSNSEIEKLLKDSGEATIDGIYESLNDANIGDMGFFRTTSEVADTLYEALKTDPSKIKGIVDNYYSTFNDAIDQQKTIAQAKLSEAFDVSSAISGLDYGNISEELQNIAYQTVSNLDFDFFSKLSESGKTVEQWTTEMLNQLNAISKADNAKIEAGFELQTKFNGGEISYGEYVNNLKNVESIIDGLNLKSEAKEQLKISLGLDENGVIDQYNSLVKRLTDPKNYDFNITENEAKSLLDGLSYEELSVAVDVITEMSHNNVNETIDQVREAIDRELTIKGLTLDLNIETETAKLESLSTALSESVSGVGLAKESISAVEDMFKDLDSYDQSKLFERTANGIRLNSDELRRLNSEYKNTNISDLNKEMDALGDIYNQTKEELYGLTYGTEEYDNKARELSSIEERIKATEKLASQYEGLSSAYQEWQIVESAGSQRDMYESVIEGLENIDDEISRGWYDDATIEFLELLTGKDLSTAGIEEIKEAYKSLKTEIEHTTYSVRDFFTVDDEGNSTNAGVYNFLDAVGQLEEEAFGGKDIVQRDEDGNVIAFDFQLAGGDEAVAEALGISEELVQIMVRAADDAGFVVSMDGTYQQLDVLKKKAAEAAKALKDTFKVTDYSFFQDGSEEGIIKDYQEALKVWESFKKNKNADGTVNMSVEGAEEAFTLVSTLQSMVDQLSEPVYMELDTSDVEKEMQTPLKNLQQYETLLQTEHQLKLKGTDTSGIEEDKEEILDYFEELSPEIKADLGIKDDSREEIKQKLEDGTIEVPATVDLQVEMNETLRDMVNVALYNAGIIDEGELETRVDVSVYAEEVDTSDVKNKTEKAVKEAVEDKGEEAVAVETKIELETTIEEATELIQQFEDKDITIDVAVKGLDDVKELNTNIDLATKIDGNVDNLSEFVEGAKELSKLDKNIESDVTANVYGNVIDTKEYKINNLKVFADSAEPLAKANIGYIESEVTANVYGNVIDKKEKGLDNLSVFADSAKPLAEANIGTDVNASVTANVYGNVINKKEKAIDNLSVFAEEASVLKDYDIGTDVNASVTANVYGNVINKKEKAIDNISVFVEELESIDDLNGKHISTSVTANVNGNVTKKKEKAIDNISVYAEEFETIKDLNGKYVSTSATANVYGNVIDKKEKSLDNLSMFADEIETIKDLNGKHVSTSVTANVNGNVVKKKEENLNNLGMFADELDKIKDLNGVNISASVTANAHGNVIKKKEKALDNLSVFADEVDRINDLNGVNISTSATANVYGNVVKKEEEDINSLGVFADKFNEIKDLNGEHVSTSVTANVNGNIVKKKEEAINNLSVFADEVDSIKDLNGVNVSTSVTANVYGNVIKKKEKSIDNLSVFADEVDSIKDLNGVNVSTSVTANVNGNVANKDGSSKIGNIKSYITEANDLKDIGSPTSTTTANIDGNLTNDGISKLKTFSSIAQTLKSIGSVAIKVTASVATETIGKAIELLKSIANGGFFKNHNATIDVKTKVDSSEVDSYKAPKKDGKVKYTVDSKSVDNWKAPSKDGTVNYSASVEALTDSQKHKSGTITYKAKISGFPIATGTANANGSTSGRAFARGNWGIKGNGVALGGELGTEVVVRNGRWFTVGDEGAEFFRYKKNDIVFNAAQTESLFKYGGIKGANPRGKMLASGTAFAEGLAFGGSSGYGGAGRVSSNSVTGKSYSSSSSSSSSSSDEFEETFDWIEIAISRIERAIDNLDQKANNVYESWSTRNKALRQEISKVEEEIALQQRAYEEYMSAANAVGLSSSWAKKVRNGTVDISTITNETLAEKVKDYQDLYEKALACKDAIAELKETEAELYKQRFDNVITRYDGILDSIDHEKAMLEEYINQIESNELSSYSVHDKEDYEKIVGYYQQLILKEQDNIRKLEKKRSELVAEMQRAVDDGVIKEGSEAWNDMQSEINDVTLAIEQANTALIDYNNSIAEMHKESFDNVVSQYDNELSTIEFEKRMLEEKIAQAEAQGMLVSEEYYKALADKERENIAELEKEKADLLKELDDAMASGAIEEGSDAWYEMCNEINDVTLAIEESNTALLEYEQTLQQLSWETFDMLQDKLSQITDEANFLIDLMSHRDLYDDSGQLTDEGMTVMGLHGQNYNVYMAQADEYAREIERLNQEIAKDPYDQELIDRRDELLEKQRESILAAEDEKEAIVDMVEEGIQLELDALQERIDKYEEALDAQKDLYDYQKKVAEQTKKIASLEKQMGNHFL